jgi:hypothetical protein
MAGLPWNHMGEAAGVGGLGAGLMGMFDPSQNPASAGMPYLNQISGVNQQYLNPYNQMGQQAGQNLQGQYGSLLSNPGGVLNQIGSSYHQSPGFQFALHQALMGANQGAAAGGMAGSPMGQQENMGVATGMANQDYYNYLNHAMGMYGQGLQGEQGMYQGGLQAGMGAANNISQALANQAQMAYAGQANQNQNQGSIFSNIAGGIGDLAAFSGL